MRTILSISFLLWSMTAAAAQTPSLLLQERLSTSGTFKADFVQSSERQMSDLKGSIVVSQPDKLYWSERSPKGKLNREIVVSGDKVQMIEHDLRQVTMSEQSVSNQLFLLSDSSPKLDKQFDISVVREGEKEIFTFVPKPNQKQDFLGAEKIILTFVKSKISLMLVKTSFDDTVSFEFKDVQLNPRMSRNLFKPKKLNKYDCINCE